eukprot:2172993-Pleurochrysis_carterae.AAC.1
MYEARCPSRDPRCPSLLVLISLRGVLSSSSLSRGSDHPREHARYPDQVLYPAKRPPVAGWLGAPLCEIGLGPEAE